MNKKILCRKHYLFLQLYLLNLLKKVSDWTVSLNTFQSKNV